MHHFTQKIHQTLQTELKNNGIDYDETILKKVSSLYADLSSKWDGEFELRPKQLLFSYLSILGTLKPQKEPLALGLGCGEGKQEGFGVALVGAYELLKRNNNHAKLLFLTASEDLVQQMKDSLPLKDIKDLYIIDEDTTAQDAKQSGIYLCDFNNYLRLSLQHKKGANCALFENLDRIFVDEFHALLATSDHITAQEPNVNNFLAKEKKSLLAKFQAYKELLEDIKNLKQTYPQLVAHANSRYKTAFNPSIVQKDGKPLEFWLYKEYQHTKQHILQTLEIDSFYTFLTLLDTASNALGKELGKDYYLFKKDGNIIEYCTAQSFSAKPMLNTSFSDNTLSVLILLQHTDDLSKECFKEEFLFVARTYLSQTTSKIAPLESIELHNAKNFTVASATLKGVKKQLSHLGFRVNFLQDEIELSLSDKNVIIKELQHKSPLQNKELQNSPYTQIAITAQSAKTLQQIASQLQSDNLYGYKIVKLYRNPINPDDVAFEKQIVALQKTIYTDPLQKRVILIQGLGEGSNIFKLSPYAHYRAKLYKLDIGAIDKVTQTRYRVGVKGRAKGVFEHSFSLDFSHSAALTHSDVTKLKTTPDKAQALLEIQRQILQDKDNETVVVHKTANNPSFNPQRRDALKTIAAATLLTTASNPLIELLNATFGKTLLQPSEVKADDVAYPPGIATCRDKVIKSAYYILETHNDYHVSNKDIFKGIMRISSKHYLPLEFPRVKENTPYIEPAYWFLCAKADVYSGSIWDKLEKKILY